MGIVVVGYGSRFSEYTDPNWEQPFLKQDWTNRLDTAFHASTNGNRETFDTMSDEWFAAKAKAQTPRNQCFDLGAGLIVLGISMGILFVAKRVHHISDLACLTTPKTRRSFLVLATMVWLSFIPAEWVFYNYTLDRGDYPWFGDEIAIPCFGVLILGLIGLPFVLLGVVIALRSSHLPLAIFSRPIFSRPYIVSFALWIAAVLAVAVMVFGVIMQPPIVPSALMTLYLILSGRAAAASQYVGSIAEFAS
jgi:hypothetical protein